MGNKRFQLSGNHLPLAPCRACLESQEMTRGNSSLLITYCIHNRVLAMLNLRDGEPDGPWRSICPVSLAEARDLIQKGNTILEGFLEKAADDELTAMPVESFYRA